MAHPLKQHTAFSKRILEKLRKICLGLPQATEKIAWGEPTFRCGEKGKIFVMYDDNHHNAGHVGAWCNAPDGMQASLVRSDPQRFYVPPYMGPKGWVGVRLDTDPDWGQVAAIVEEAYRVTAPKKLLALLDERSERSA